MGSKRLQSLMHLSLHSFCFHLKVTQPNLRYALFLQQKRNALSEKCNFCQSERSQRCDSDCVSIRKLFSESLISSALDYFCTSPPESKL